MDDRDTAGDVANVVAQAQALWVEILTPVLEATAGYKRTALDHGLGEEAADLLAVEFHA